MRRTSEANRIGISCSQASRSRSACSSAPILGQPQRPQLPSQALSNSTQRPTQSRCSATRCWGQAQRMRSCCSSPASVGHPGRSSRSTRSRRRTSSSMQGLIGSLATTIQWACWMHRASACPPMRGTTSPLSRTGPTTSSASTPTATSSHRSPPAVTSLMVRSVRLSARGCVMMASWSEASSASWTRCASRTLRGTAARRSPRQSAIWRTTTTR